MIIDIWNRKLQ